MPIHSLDAVITALDRALKTLNGHPRGAQPSPYQGPDIPLSEAEQKRSGALMRVNHVGEICAQALYSAQHLSTQDLDLKDHFAKAAGEETQHLAWTAQRLQELGTHPSRLNPLWYAGAFAMGYAAGQLGRAKSLGFVLETERQVEQHLQSHLDQLPANDQASRTIVAQMQRDEAAHAAQAHAAGAAAMPWPVRWLMRAGAKVMTTTAYYV